MQKTTYRALIVDDEDSVRHLAVRALTREGFRCDAASDGQEAMRLVEHWRYDAVVTDLRMPRRHGHALVVDLLKLERRPLVVVLTGVCDPKLVRDLVTLGIDDIMFKPVNYDSFAAKVKAIVDRRQALATSNCGDTEETTSSFKCGGPLAPGGTSHITTRRGEQRREVFASGSRKSGDSRLPLASFEKRSNSPANDDLLVQEPECPADETKISLAEVEQKLTEVSGILPVSQAALQVFEMTNQGTHSDEQVSAAIERDPALTTELLRLANNSAYNPSGEKVVDTISAIARVGQRRVGELAFSSSTLAAVTPGMFPWMDMELSWQRSIAAGVAVELLVSEGKHEGHGEDLFLCATMHGLGRVVLGSLYPQVYRRLVKNCHDRNVALQEEENNVFPENHAKTLSRLLSEWNIPSEVSEPLKYVLDDYPSLSRLEQPLRDKVQLLKLAVLIGQTVVEGWESWDVVEVPSPDVLHRLSIHDLPEVIKQAKTNFKMILKLQPRRQALRDTGRTFLRPQSAFRQIAYCNLSEHRFDFLAIILGTMGIKVNAKHWDLDQTSQPLLVNCLGAHPECLGAGTGFERRAELMIITDEANADSFHRFGTVMSLPASYRELRAACSEALRQTKVTKAVTDSSTGQGVLYDCRGIRNVYF